MDNLQPNLRVAMVAGMWLADGFVSAKYRLSNNPRSKTKTLTPEAGYVSKDYDYIQFIAQVLKENNVGCYIRQRRRIEGRAKVWNLTVVGHKRFRAWVELMQPHLMGRKLLAAQALSAAWQPDETYRTKGRYQKSEAQQARELAAYQLVRRLNSTGGSETIMVGSAEERIMG